nr:hypothetical protein [Bacillaceae bacterium]
MPEAFRRPARFRNADEEKLRGFAPKVYSFLAGALAEIAIGAVRRRGKDSFPPAGRVRGDGNSCRDGGPPILWLSHPLADAQQDFAAREPNPFL